MLLAIDVGNTNTEFGVFEGENLLGSFRMMTKSNATSDEIGLLVCQYFQRFGLDRTRLEAVMVASVVPQVMYSVTSAIIKYFGVEPLVVGTDVDAGLKFAPRCYETGRLGADRAINCIAALEKYGGPFVILDFGTATTFDCVTGDAYLGGLPPPSTQWVRTAYTWAAPLDPAYRSAWTHWYPEPPCCPGWNCKCPRPYWVETR